MTFTYTVTFTYTGIARGDNPTMGWFKSSRSNPNGNQCVEVCFGTDLVYVRDSKNGGAGPVLAVPVADWTAFLDEVAGRAPVGSSTMIQVVLDAHGGASLRKVDSPNATLSYTPGEWSAFVAGVRCAEFDLPSSQVLAS